MCRTAFAPAHHVDRGLGLKLKPHAARAVPGRAGRARPDFRCLPMTSGLHGIERVGNQCAVVPIRGWTAWLGLN